MEQSQSEREKNKLVVLVPFTIWPPHFGSSERAYNIIKQLARRNEFRLSVLYTDYTQVTSLYREKERLSNTKIMEVGPSQRWAQAFNPLLILKGLLLSLKDRPDIILCEHLWSSIHAMVIHFLTGVPFILDEHNAEYVRLKRMGKDGIAEIVRILERLACRFATKVICVSENDRVHLINLGVKGDKISVVYNAVDTDQYRPNSTTRKQIRKKLDCDSDSPVLLFFGKLDYQPNAEAVEIIVREIMPRVLDQNSKTRFVICGYNPPQRQYAHPNLIFTGVVPKIEDYINASDVVVAPLISGGGTKLKIVQAISCGRPVVTTTIGSEGIRKSGDWMRVTNDWDRFADLALELSTNPSSLLQSQLRVFRNTYSWKHITKKFIKLIDP